MVDIEGISFVLVILIQSALSQVIYKPSFTSEWYQAEAGNRDKSLLTIPHDLGEYPVKVDVQVKISESGKEYIFSGIGSSQRDDDLNHDFGAVIYRYNDIHIQLGFPFIDNNEIGPTIGLAYTGSGTLYDGPELPMGPYYSGLVRVRAWIASDMPPPVMNMSSYISRLDGENYKELQHALGFYPDIVTVRTLMDDGYMSDGIGVIFVSNQPSRYQSLGGVLFGYDDQLVRLWVPSPYKNSGESGGVFTGVDGYPFVQKFDGTAYILGWKILARQQVFRFQQTVDATQSHYSTVDISCPFNWTNYLVSVQYKLPSADGGMVFHAAGTTQAIPVARYGGIIYVYTQNQILIWNPLNTAVVYIGDRWGRNQGSQESNVADVIMKIFHLDENKCEYPELPTNASITMSGLGVNDTVLYSCNDGYEFYGGDLFRTCMRSRKWSGSMPTCIDQSLLAPLICTNTTGNSTSMGFSIEDLIKLLTIAKKKTNSYLRTITCADDQRLSARVIGWSGVLVISVVVSLLVVPDLLSLLKWTFCRGSQ